MNADELKIRTKDFALRVLKLVSELPKTVEGRAIANQIVRFRHLRGRSRTEFAAKIGIVLEEADETLLWLELIVAAKLLPQRRVEPLLKEADELVAIMAASRKSALARTNLKSEI